MSDHEPRRDCDPDRLGRLLRDDLPEAEKADAIAHLDDCPDCQQGIERLAAGSPWWGDARLLDGRGGLVPYPTVDARGPGGGGADDLTEWPGSDELSLDFLEPPTGPGELGRLGPYGVLGVIGRGGMGVVLKANDSALNRFVAIKVLAPQLAGGAAARRRFAREAKAAAAVSHEHVVAIHAVDPASRPPYLVMQYVAGKSLQDRIECSGTIETGEILRIGMQVASGLAAAHAQGLIHRDVKPSNILLENGIERVKITDFGLARAVDDASMTQSGLIAGTPQYMAPEQARGEPVDHRADLFSLGSVLYTMAAGRPPFRAETTMAVLRRVCDDRPRSLREVNPDVPAWLEAIIDKLHSKDPADRYQSADEVAVALGGWLAHLQNPAGFPRPEPDGLPPVAPLRPRKSRRPAVAAALLALAGLVALGGSAGVAQVADMLATVFRIKTANGTVVVQVEDPTVKVRVDGEELVITGAGFRELRVGAGRHEVTAERDGVSVFDEFITVERGGKRAVRISREPPAGATVAVRPRPAPGQPGDARPDAPAVSGPIIPPGGGSGTPRSQSGGLERGEIRHFDGHTDWVRAVAFSTDGRLVFSGGMDGTLRFWETATGKQTREIKAHKEGVSSIAVGPDGGRALTGGLEGVAKLWDLKTGEELRRFAPGAGAIATVALSPDGRRALTGGGGQYVRGGFAPGASDFSIRVWDVETGQELKRLAGHEYWVHGLAFSPDGRLAVSASLDGTARVWDLDKGVELRRIHDDTQVWSVTFLPDGRLVSAGDDVVIWDTSSGRQMVRLKSLAAATGIGSVAVIPDGRYLVTGGNDGLVHLWDLKTNREVFRYGKKGPWVSAVAVSPDGRLVLSGGKDWTVRLWSVDAAFQSPPGGTARGTEPPVQGFIRMWMPDDPIRALRETRTTRALRAAPGSPPERGGPPQPLPVPPPPTSSAAGDAGADESLPPAPF